MCYRGVQATQKGLSMHSQGGKQSSDTSTFEALATSKMQRRHGPQALPPCQAFWIPLRRVFHIKLRSETGVLPTIWPPHSFFLFRVEADRWRAPIWCRRWPSNNQKFVTHGKSSNSLVSFWQGWTRHCMSGIGCSTPAGITQASASPVACIRWCLPSSVSMRGRSR